MRYIILLLLSFFIISSSVSYSQIKPTPIMVKRIDSLKTVIAAEEVTDTLRMAAYKLLAYDLAKSDSTSAELYIKKGLQFADKLGDEESKMWFTYYRCLLFRLHGHFEEVKEEYLELSKISKERGYPAIASNALNDIGSYYQKNKDYKTALPYMMQSVELFESLDDKSQARSPYENFIIMYWFQGNYKSAILYIKKNIALYKALENSKGLANAYNTLGIMYNTQGNHKEALQVYELSIQSYESIGNKLGLVTAIQNIGNIYSTTGEYDKALQTFKKSLKISREIESDWDYNRSITAIGSIFLDLNKLDSASNFFNQSIEFMINDKDTFSLVAFYYEIGDKYAKKGNIPKSLSLNFEALRLVEEQRDTNLIGIIYSSIANVYRVQKDIVKAIEFKQKAIDHLIISKDDSRIASAKNGMADLLIETDNYSEALKESRQSLTLFQAYQDSCGYSKCHLSMAKAFAGLNKTDSVKHYLDQAIPQALKCSNNRVLGESHIQLAYLYTSLNQEGQAQEAFEEALKYSKRADIKKTVKEAAEGLYPIYEKQKNYKKAFETLDLFQASKDSLFNQENTRILVQKEMEYTFEKEQQQIEMEQGQQLERQKGFTYISILGSLFLMGIALSIYINYRNKQKANDLLNEQKTNELLNKQKANELLNEQNAEIIKQKAELEKSDKMKSRFFANISHELRTPLTLISSPIQQLIKTEKDNLNPNTVQELQLMERNAKQLKRLVNDIMDLSKLESNKIELYDQEVAAAPFLRRITSNFNSLSTHLGIQYDIQVDLHEDIHLLFDAGKVEKIINNLLSNAIKHTSSSGSVHLVAQKEASNLKVQVIDTGQGIAQEDLPHIFDRYFQSKRSDAVLQGGTGVGLALAKELTSLMGGRLSVDSQLGEGSTFTLLLPYHLVTEPKLAVIGLEEEDEEISLVHLYTNVGAVATKKFNVLIVEDHQDMQKFIQRLLDNKYHTHTANHGIQALKVLEEQSIDLIVSDVMMPEMDGYSLLKGLKEHATFKQIPVVMLTALDSENNKLKALTLGVDDYLSKPFSPEELLARTHNLLHRYEVRRKLQEESEIDILKEVEQKPVNRFEVEGLKTKAVLAKQSKTHQPSTKQKDTEWLDKVEQIMRKEIENPEFNLFDIATQLHSSQRQFQRKMKQMTGLTPKKFQIEVALQMGRDLLEKQAYGSVKAIAYSVGMTNVWRFSQLYEARFGKKPRTYF